MLPVFLDHYFGGVRTVVPGSLRIFIKTSARRERPRVPNVDPMTRASTSGRRPSLTCRLETMWKRRVFPMVVVAAALLVIAHIVDSARSDAQYMAETLLIAVVVAWAVLIGRLALNLLRSRHNPREVEGYVYIRDVDGGVAAAWASAHPIRRRWGVGPWRRVV